MFRPIAKIAREKFEQAALPFDQFRELAETRGERGPWDQRYAALAPDAAQARRAEAFQRPMPVLCLTGTWCGDCALQGAALQRVAEASPGTIEPRFLQREEAHAELVASVQLNEGFRVPITFFFAEDFAPVSIFGDRTLSRYRSMARKALPETWDELLPPPPEDPLKAVLDEVFDEVERVQLLLRLSGRLRERHGD